MGKRVALLALRQIDRLSLHADVEASLKVGRGALQFLAIARRQPQIDALARKLFGNGKTNALAGAGYGGGFSSQMKLHGDPVGCRG